MTYVLMSLNNTLIYQGALDGFVQGYYDEAGVLLFTAVPEGQSAEVVDANPPRLPWMV